MVCIQFDWLQAVLASQKRTTKTAILILGHYTHNSQTPLLEIKTFLLEIKK